jgi:hypothetical protein
MRQLALALALGSSACMVLGLSACEVHIAHFTAIGNPVHDAVDVPSSEPIHGETSMVGSSATPGLPRIETPAADALSTRARTASCATSSW